MAKYHKSIRTLPVYNFYEILSTGDLSFLYYDEKGNEDLEETWKNIYNEFCKESNIDNRHLRQKGKIEYLKLKHYRVTLILVLCIDSDKKIRANAREKLKGYNYIFREDKPWKEEYVRLQGQLKSLYTKIEIEEAKLPKEAKREAVKLMKQVVAIENMFPGRVIDVYVMPVQKWLALVEVANEKAKQMNHVGRS